MRRWIWGASEGGRMALAEVAEVDGVVDSDPGKWGSDFCGYRVSPPSAVARGDEVVVATIWAQEVARECERHGIRYRWPVFWGRLSEGAGAVDWDAVRAVRGGLDDDQSIAAYTMAVHAWATDDLMLVTPSQYEQYRHPAIWPWGLARILDAGAYDGADTARWRAEGHEVVPVEPLPRAEIEGVIRGALGAEGPTVRLIDDTSASRVDEAGTVEVPALRLEDLGPFGLIKADIEGAELPMLAGAVDYLRETRPRLAICIYHRLTDLWRIPLLVREIWPDAPQWIGHHSHAHQETVLYVDPRRVRP